MRAPFITWRFINWYFVVPVIGYVATAIAIVVAVVHIAHHAGRGAVTPTNAVHISPNDGLARELAHCQTIGARAANDPDCNASWAENRRRFFSGSTTAHPAAAPATRAKSRGLSQP
jgi:conjugative transfer region protein TrbK